MHHPSVFPKMPFHVIGRALCFFFFITCRAVMVAWVGGGGDVPERAADVCEGMEISDHDRHLQETINIH